MSGFLAMTPKPEHGTSHKTRSNLPQSVRGWAASFCTASAQVTPQRANALRSSGTRDSTYSPLVSCPLFCMHSASVKLLPPGAAHRSATFWPGCAPTQRAANWLARPCTWKSPLANARLAAGEPLNSTSSACGQGPGCTLWPSVCKRSVNSSSVVRSVFTRIAVAGR